MKRSSHPSYRHVAIHGRLWKGGGFSVHVRITSAYNEALYMLG
jgi:hypothetical protein